MFEIRDFTPTDLAHCTTLFTQTFAQPPWHDRWSIEQAQIYLHDIVHTPGFYGCVAQRENVLIGLCLGRIKQWHAGNEFFIEEMCIANEYQRQGVGKQLMQYTKQALKQQGVKYLTLLTLRGSHAEKFYQTLEFSQVNSLVFMKNEL